MKSIPIVERKLGREDALGQCIYDKGIEIDPRLKPKDRLDTVIHEVLHWQNPHRSEKWVIKTAHAICRSLWKDNWRRIQS